MAKKVKETFDDIGDAIRDVSDWVGDVIRDVSDGVGDIIRDVADGVGDVINYVLDNPIEAIAKVAAIATGQFWAIPLIDGAVVLANGGDFGDAVKAAAISYVAQGAGNVASTYTSAALKQAGVSATVANIVSAGTKSATTALVYGQDPLKAFANGGLQAGVAAGLGEISNKMEEQFGSRFEDLRGGVKDSIFAGVAAELEGGNLSETQMDRIIGKYTGVAGLMEDFLEKNAGFSEAQASLITNALSSAVSTALAGNPNLSGEAFFKTISDAGAAELKKIIDRPVNDAIDKVSGAFNKTETSANALNDAINKANTASESYNNLQTQLKARVNEQDRLKGVYDEALATFNGNQTQANADAVNAAAKTFNDYAAQLETDYNNNFKDQLTYWEGEFNKYNATIPDLESAYKEDLDWMVTKTEDLDVALKPSMGAAERAVTLTLRPAFDEDAYRELTGLDAGEDVYSHFLSQGQGLPTERRGIDNNLENMRLQALQAALGAAGYSDIDLIAANDGGYEAALGVFEQELRSIRDFTSADYEDLAARAISAANEASGGTAKRYDLAEGVTGVDVANGTAQLVSIDGKLQYALASQIADAFGGRVVTTNVDSTNVYNPNALRITVYAGDGSGNFTDFDTGESAGSAADITRDSGIGITLPELVAEGVYNNNFGGGVARQVLDLGDEAGAVLDSTIDTPIYDAVSKLYNFMAGDRGGITGGITRTDNETMNNIGAVITNAGAQGIDAINGLLVYLEMGEPDSELAKTADRMFALSDSLLSGEFRGAVKDMEYIMANSGDGWRGAINGVVKSFSEYPTQFLGYYVGSELLQEIPLIMTAAVAGTAAGAAAAGVTAANWARRVGQAVGIGTDIALNAGEAVGATTQSAYEDAYATAIRVGKSEAEADQIARELSTNAGTIALAAAAITGGWGSQLSQKLFKTAQAKDAFNTLTQKFLDGTEVFIKEGVAESIEEALPQLYVATELYNIDPTIDVAKQTAGAALMGGIIGSTVSGTIYTGNAVADTLLALNQQVRDAVQSSDNPEAAAATLRELGIDDNVTLNNLLNTSYDQFYVSTNEARAEFKRVNPDFEVDDATIDSIVENTSQNNLQNTVEQYVDPRYLDRDEVKAIAASEGLTLTDEEADAFVQQGSTAQIAAAETAAQKTYDSQYVTYQEALARFQSLGFTPAARQVNDFVGKFNEAAKLKEINAYVDPRQVTEAEARAFFDALGYTPTNQEVQAYMGQGDANFAANQESAVKTYVDPRQVTEEEARQFFSDLGYTPTDAEVADFVAQVAETEQKTAIDAYVDPRFVTYDEVQAIADQEGLTLTEALAKTYLGQKDEAATLEAARGAFDPLATTYSEAKQFFADLGYTPSYDEIAQFVASATEEAQRGAVGEYVDPRQVTVEESRAFLEGLGYTPTDAEVARFVGQVNEAQQETAIGEYVDPRLVSEDEVVAAYAELGLSRPTEEDVQRLMGQYMETELAGRAEEYLPTARYNSIINILDNFTGEVGVSQEMQDALNVVKADMINALGDLGLEVAAIDQATQRLEDAVGRVASGDAEASGLYAYIDDAVQSLTDAGLTQEEVQATLSEIVGSPATDNTEATGIYATIADMGTTIDNLNDLSTSDVEGIVSDALSGLNNLSTEDVQGVVTDIVGAPATADTPATGLYATIGDLNNISEEDVTTIVSDALSGLENISEEDVQNVVNGIIGAPATEDAGATGIYAALESSTNAILDILGSPATDDTEATGLYDYIDTAVETIGADLTSLIGTVGTPGYTDADGNGVAATGIFAELAGLEAAGLSRDEAIAQLSADLGVAVTDLTNEITTVEENLAGDIAGVTEDVGELAGILGTPEVFDDPSTEVDESRDPTGLFGVIKGYETAGMERDQAIQEALGDLSTELGLTEQAILDELGLTKISLGEQIDASEAALTEQIGDVETALTTRIDELETAGIARDEALQTALGELAADLGTTEENILAQLGTTEENLLAEIGGVQATLEKTAAATDQDLDFISNLIGKPARDVTQTDVDFVADLIAQQQVLDELSLEYQQYDVNNDGLLDINDQTLLEQALAGEQVQLAPESAFVTDPTGVYGALYDTQQDIQQQMEQDKQEQLDAIIDMNTQINTQLQTNQRMSNVSDLRNMLMQQQDLYGQQVSVRTPDPMRINYLYDFSSIFANPQQASLFPSPYAKGGQVEDTTDKLLRIIGE